MKSEMRVAAERANLVFSPSSSILRAAQRYEVFDDCKTFVDSPMLSDPETILRRFEDVDACDEAAVKAFVKANFGSCGCDLETCDLEDWKETPSVLKKLNEEDREWAKALNGLWRTLGRRVKSEKNRCRSSLLAPARPFVAPGGRFREPCGLDGVCDSSLGCLWCPDAGRRSGRTRDPRRVARSSRRRDRVGTTGIRTGSSRACWCARPSGRRGP